MVKKACQFWEWYRLIDNKKSVSQKLNEKTRSKWDFDEDKTCQSVLIMSDIPLSLKGSLKLTSLCLGPFSKLKTHDDPERWMCVYPAYLNKNKSLQERMGAKLLVCLLSMVFVVPLSLFSVVPKHLYKGSLTSHARACHTCSIARKSCLQTYWWKKLK